MVAIDRGHMVDAKKMALISSCCCFSLLVGAIASGVYATLVYLVAFGMELWWIIESDDGLPVPAYFLCLGYLCIFFISITLLGGLAGRRINVLLAWLFVMVLFLFPECGMVIFMSLYHWTLESHYGLAEMVFYMSRVALNVLAIICVQSLYSTWRNEKLMLKRLRELNMGMAVMPQNKVFQRLPPDMERNGKHVPDGVSNQAYYSSVDQMNGGGGMLVEAGVPKIPRAYSSMAYHQQRHQGHYQDSIPVRGLHSEFNASVFNGFFHTATIPPRSHSVLGLATLPSSASVYEEDMYYSRSTTPSRRRGPDVGSMYGPGPYSTQSLDRRLFSKSRQRSTSMDALHLRTTSRSGGGRGRQSDPHGRRTRGGGSGAAEDYDMYAYRNHGSMSSMAQSAGSDDVKQYRDVAL